jgi:hypothetical protein
MTRGGAARGQWPPPPLPAPAPGFGVDPQNFDFGFESEGWALDELGAVGLRSGRNNHLACRPNPGIFNITAVSVFTTRLPAGDSMVTQKKTA